MEDPVRTCQNIFCQLTELRLQATRLTAAEDAPDDDANELEAVGVLLDNAASSLLMWLRQRHARPDHGTDDTQLPLKLGQIVDAVTAVQQVADECAAAASPQTRPQWYPRLKSSALLVRDLSKRLVQPTQQPPKFPADTAEQPAHAHKSLTNFFKEKLRSATVTRKREETFATGGRADLRVEFKDLHFFWDKIPFTATLKPDVTEFRPLDGVMFGRDLRKRTSEVLVAFCAAWQDLTPNMDNDGRERLNGLCNMSDIVLILRHIRYGSRYLDRFLVDQRNDRQLRFERHDLTALLSGSREAKAVAEQFYWQQSRVKVQPWSAADGEQPPHLTLGTREPLPLQRPPEEWETSSGGFSLVDYVLDLTVEPSLLRARKRSKTGNPRARQHLEREAQILRKIRHPHIVRLVKTYERSDEYGLLLLPAADWDLTRLLEVCCSQPTPHVRTVWRPVLMRFFGCLSGVLDYLHNTARCRHKDIKTDNILCHQNDWFVADFGESYHFDAAGGSDTWNDFTGTPINQAPETRSPTQPHGPPADVYALGCTFLDVLSVLVYGEDNLRSCRKLAPYLEHWPQVQAWIAGALKTAGGRAEPITSLLRLAGRMMAWDPGDRPPIDEVVAELHAIATQSGARLFCDACDKHVARHHAGQAHPRASSLRSGHSRNSSVLSLTKAMQKTRKAVNVLKKVFKSDPQE